MERWEDMKLQFSVLLLRTKKPKHPPRTQKKKKNKREREREMGLCGTMKEVINH